MCSIQVWDGADAVLLAPPVWEDEVLDPDADRPVEAGSLPGDGFGRMVGAVPPGVAVTELSDTDLLVGLRGCEELASALLVEQSRYLAELRGRRLLAQAVAHPHVGGECPAACCDEDGWVTLEVAAPLALTERQVQARIDTAARLSRHPLMEAALAAGRVQSWTGTRLLEHLSTLAGYVSPEGLGQVEAETVEWLLDQPRTVTQLNARMRRLLLAARAAAQDGTRPDGAPDGSGPDSEPGGGPVDGQRRVSVAPAATPGLAELVALLPEDDALAIKATLYALGHDRVDLHDPRTADQRRADLLVTLITGRGAALGRPADTQAALRDPVDLQVRLDVTVPADTLTGGSASAWLPGYGDIPAATARHLAAGCGAAPGQPRGGVRALVYDPATGALLGFAARPVRMTWLDGLPPGRGYQHSQSLETAVRLRDGTCRAPGCTRRAARCDCDHVLPYPHGHTSLANTCSLCRRHHRLKTHAPGWTLTPGDSSGPGDGGAGSSGALTWTTPTGTRLRTYLHDYRPTSVPARGDPARSDQTRSDPAADEQAPPPRSDPGPDDDPPPF